MAAVDFESIQVSGGKRKLRKAALVFILVMVILTFLSNTINNYSLARVEYEIPSRGSVVKDISMDGVIRAGKVFEYYADASARVLEVSTAPGDRAEKGQRLALLDTETLKRRLLDETDRLEQKKLSLQKLRNEAAADSMAGVYENYNRSVQTARVKMERVQKDYELAGLLYEAGSETAVNLERIQDDMADARTEYERAVRDRDRAVEESRIKAENSEIEIKALQLDIDMQERVVRDLKEHLDMCDIHAPFNGLVVEMNLVEGTMADTSRPLYRMADISEGYRLAGTVEAKTAAHVAPGDTARVSVDALGFKILEGRVVEIKDSPGMKGVMKDIAIEVTDEELEDGQLGSAAIRKNTKTYEVLVSNNAVGQDNSGYFVYVLKERKGLLGDESYVRAVRITIGEADSEKTAVISGLSSFEKVIAVSDKPLSDGARVMIGK